MRKDIITSSRSMPYFRSKSIKVIKRYDIALATRKFEIEMFWKRSLFFWGFVALAFAGYAVSLKDNNSYDALPLMVSCFGLVISVGWSLVNRGSKYWQENWEQIIEDIDENGEITDESKGVFTERREREEKEDNAWLKARKFSVSKVVMAISDFVVLIWISLIIKHTLLINYYDYKYWIVFFTIIFIILMCCYAKSSEHKVEQSKSSVRSVIILMRKWLVSR